MQETEETRILLEDIKEVFGYVKRFDEKDQYLWMRKASWEYSINRNNGLDVEESEKRAIEEADKLVRE